jgi:acetoin utilization deacetylase AcuC-like enzyme
MVRIYYSPKYVGSAYAFDTTRKASWIADSLVRSPIPGLTLVEPEPLTLDQLAQVHDPGYIEAVRTGQPRSLAESQGFHWDPGLWPMVLASNGGAVAAGLAALQDKVAGSLSSGLHHARDVSGAGFCTFNGLVLAARQVLTAGATSVLIVDLDAHCGGGTASLIADEPRIWQIDVSVNSYDSYAASERTWLDVVGDSTDYLPTIQRKLDQADRQGLCFDLCLYNAGMDPHEDCSTGGLTGLTQAILAQREQMVFAWCKKRQLPIAFVLAGGYTGPHLDEQGLVDLHRLTLSAAPAVVTVPGANSL